MDAHAQAMWDLMEHTMRSERWRPGDDGDAQRRYRDACRAMSDDHALFDAVIAKIIDPGLDPERFTLLAERERLDQRGQLQAAQVMAELADKVMYKAGWNVQRAVRAHYQRDVPRAFTELAAGIPESADRLGAYRVAAMASWLVNDPAMEFKAHLDRLWDAIGEDDMRTSLSRAFANALVPAYARGDAPEHARDRLAEDETARLDGGPAADADAALRRMTRPGAATRR